MKSKITAGTLALFLGSFGIHKFYLNQNGMGVLYLILCWTFVPTIISILEALIFFTVDEYVFDLKYNDDYLY